MDNNKTTKQENTPQQRILFVSKKSEATTEAAKYNLYQMFRTRLTCNCKEGQNRRDGILIANDNVIIIKIIRCKACAKEVKP